MRAAPAVSCAMVEVERTRAYRAAEAIRHSLRNGLTAYNALSPVSRSSLATVAPEKLIPRNLTPAYRASGPHVFAVRSRSRSLSALPASTASRPTFRGDHDTPL